MANAKLSGSLLAFKGTLPAIAPESRMTEPSNSSAGQSPLNGRDRPQSVLSASTPIVGPISPQVSVPEGNWVSSSSTSEERHGFGSVIRFGLAACGVAATTAVGFVLFIHVTEHNTPTIALRANPAFPNVTNPAPADPEPTAEARTGAASAITRVDSPPQLRTTGAATSAAGLGLSPTAAAAPLSPQPEPVTVGYIPAPEVQAAAGRLPPREQVAVSKSAPNPAVAPVSTTPEPVTAGYAPAPATKPAEVHLSAEEVAALLARGDLAFGDRDVVSARLYYERAAEGGDAQASLRLGETYDPAFLAKVHLNGIRSDAAAAARWYRRARELGAIEAEILLSSVAANEDADKTSTEMNRLFEQFLARQSGQPR